MIIARVSTCGLGDPDTGMEPEPNPEPKVTPAAPSPGDSSEETVAYDGYKAVTEVDGQGDHVVKELAHGGTVQSQSSHDQRQLLSQPSIGSYPDKPDKSGVA
ncbi:hypothetical protein FRC07_011337 [Ceratobasidium sp. 392]|nr:hypothetical protein FRC07_011337 [Ceratobasidium sp. 392]